MKMTDYDIHLRDLDYILTYVSMSKREREIIQAAQGALTEAIAEQELLRKTLKGEAA